MSVTVPTSLDVEIPGLESVFIAGEWVDPAEKRLIDVISPSTEDVLTQVADPGTGDADRAIAAAQSAFADGAGAWPSMTPEERVEVCTRLCDELEARLDDMNRAWCFEAGAPIAHGEMINSGAGKMVWREALETALGLPWEEDRTGTLIRREPIGVVLAVLTYNGPVVLMGMKVIPALLAGCPVIIKHAPESPLTGRLVAEAVRAAGFPEGVVSVLPAGTEVTQYMVGHDGVDMVALTGGTKIGVDVVKRTADRLARTALELGGKAPAIIAEDADLDEVMETLVPGASGFLGQVCVNLSRVLAPRSRYDEVVEAMGESYRALKVGNPFDPSVDHGPLAVKRARDRAEHYVAVATEQGAEIVAGGKRPDDQPRGWYFEPTLLRAVDNEMTVAREEIFGPVTAVIPYDDLDQAIKIANDTPFGLAASVYSKDQELAMSLARRIRSGGVAINLAGISLNQPFGGFKQSGWGRECGPEGILEFTEIKQILLGGGSYLDAGDEAV